MKNILFVFLLMMLSNHLCAAEKYKNNELVVWKLYHDFLWQAVMDSGPDDVIHQQPLNVLKKYFDDELAGLIRADYECAEKAKEICNIDFDIIFNSQDPYVSRITIDKRKSMKNLVVVNFNHDDEENRRYSISYEVKETRDGWKISDIVYSKEHSLKKRLKVE